MDHFDYQEVLHQLWSVPFLTTTAATTTTPNFPSSSSSSPLATATLTLSFNLESFSKRLTGLVEEWNRLVGLRKEFSFRLFIQEVELWLRSPSSQHSEVKTNNNLQATAENLEELIQALTSQTAQRKGVLFHSLQSSFQATQNGLFKLRDLVLLCRFRARSGGFEEEGTLRNGLVSSLYERFLTQQVTAEARCLLDSVVLEELCIGTTMGCEALTLSRRAFLVYRPKESARQLRLALACANSHPHIKAKCRQKFSALISWLKDVHVDRLDWEVRCLSQARFTLDLLDDGISLELLAAAVHEAYTLTYGTLSSLLFSLRASSPRLLSLLAFSPNQSQQQREQIVGAVFQEIWRRYIELWCHRMKMKSTTDPIWRKNSFSTSLLLLLLLRLHFF
jgi:hypothetical protein